MSNRHPVEQSWDVNGLTLKGLSWGSPELPPLLMLHGWLDNAASFAVLAPLLEKFHVVALDMTGQGKSDHRSADASYQIWDDLPEILGVVAQLGWDDFDLLGHSRGAIMSGLLASAFPERVKHLVMLDAFSPTAVPESEFPVQLRKYLQQKSTLLHAENRVFPSVDDAANLRNKNGLSEQSALLLARRAVKSCPGGVTWTSDRRLYGASAVKLSRGQISSVLERLTMPTLVLLAESGELRSSREMIALLGEFTNLEVEYWAGGHHFHMEEPAIFLAKRIAGHLQRENL
jgi:pimeloyl-ACP methyl ester carboxylesterase